MIVAFDLRFTGVENENSVTHKIFNFLEAGLWISIAAALLVYSIRSESKQRKMAYVAIAALFMFGISDIIEVYTGAWWKPPWLLLLKALCVLALVVCLISYVKNKP